MPAKKTAKKPAAKTLFVIHWHTGSYSQMFKTRAKAASMLKHFGGTAKGKVVTASVGK